MANFKVETRLLNNVPIRLFYATAAITTVPPVPEYDGRKSAGLIRWKVARRRPRCRLAQTGKWR